MIDQIFSYREMCEQENVQTLQRGINFRLNLGYSVILMSRRPNAPYNDKILVDDTTIEYEGHDEPNTKIIDNPKKLNQPIKTPRGYLTQNGKFINAVKSYQKGLTKPEIVKVYEKVLPGVWSRKGLFDLTDYKINNDGVRDVFIFVLKLSENQGINNNDIIDIKHTRLIPSEVKKDVWRRDGGKCVICRSNKNLHFDHDLPFSRGGTSLTSKNIRLLCAKCNLSKSDKIE